METIWNQHIKEVIFFVELPIINTVSRNFFEKCRDIIQVIEKYKVFPIVRVPTNDIGIINKVLDAGAYGVICPLINNKKDVVKFTDACFYPPKGNRSFGPTLVNIDHNNYFEKSNK